VIEDRIEDGRWRIAILYLPSSILSPIAMMESKQGELT
jgi:hypothetical protein